MSCVVCLENCENRALVEPEVVDKFVKFCGEFLKEENVSCLVGDDGNRFCGGCGAMILSVLKLYETWNEVRVKLLARVAELGEVICESGWGRDSKRPGWIQLKTKCFKKGSAISPFVQLEALSSNDGSEVPSNDIVVKMEQDDDPADFWDDTQDYSISGDDSASVSEIDEPHPPPKVKANKILKCFECSRPFRHCKSLVTHTLNKHDVVDGISLTTCSLCSKPFGNVTDLQEHLQSSHEEETNENSQICCVHCPKRFTNQQSCDLHRYLTHVDLSTITCPFSDSCSEQFFSISKYNAHLAAHLPSDFILITCDQCSIAFQTADKLERHKEIHVIPESVTYLKGSLQNISSSCGVFCPLCKKPCSSQSTLTTHMYHSHSKRHLCEHCPKSFVTLARLNRHVQIAHLNTFTCDWCPQTFVYVFHLRAHVRRDHRPNLADFNKRYPSPWVKPTTPKQRKPKPKLTKKTPKKKQPLVTKDGFNCLECAKISKTRRCLLKHTLKCHETLDGIHLKQCQTCFEQFPSVDKLQDHLKSHQEPEVINKRLFCLHCSESFTTRQECDLHCYLSHVQKLPIYCPETACSSTFFSVASYNAHLQSHQPEVVLLTCDLCSFAFQTYQHLPLHKLAHLPPNTDKTVSCPEDGCDAKYSAVDRLTNHVNQIHAEESQRVELFQCKICKKLPFFLFQKDLAVHQRVHTETVRCLYCRETFAGRNELNIHHLTSHRDKRSGWIMQFPVVNPPETRPVEETRDNDPPEIARKCTYCQATFKSYRELNKHKARLHGVDRSNAGRRLVQCDLCGSSFQRKYLKRHMNKHDLLKFPCLYPNCGGKFKDAVVLKEHVISGHSLTSDTCDQCGKQCKDEAYLNRHILSAHTKPFQCGTCFKSFGTLGQVKGHERARHSNDKFKCRWCPSVSSYLSKLKSHVKKRHPDKAAELDSIQDWCMKPAVM